MEWDTVYKIITALIVSIGAGGAVVFTLSSWLGKLWADRILNNEKHKLKSELEKTRNDLEIIKETTLKFQHEKILTYRAIVDVVAHILSSLDAHMMGRLSPEDTRNRFDQFNEQRIKVYGYLAMFAPQSVMDAQDKLIDHILKIFQEKESYEWEKIRELAINMLNEIRKDIGIDKNPIEYRGEL